MPGPLRASWPGVLEDTRGPAAESEKGLCALRRVGETARLGMPLLAGSNAASPFVIWGFGLHEELEFLVEAGLSPLQALHAATLHPALFLEATDSLGTVGPGELADLVLLDADPLEDIRHTRKIFAVVLNGRYLDRQALDELLARAEEEAAAAT